MDESGFQPASRATLERPDREASEVDSIEKGLLIAKQMIDGKLAETKVRPLLVFVNGLTGSSKTSFAIALEELLRQNGIHAVNVETDLYANDKFQGADFLTHKQAWEEGRAFPRYNMKTRQDELITNQPQVIILSGAGAAQEHIKEKAALSVLMVANPLDRIARRIFRDHIEKTDQEPNPEQFLRELAESTAEGDVLEEFEAHRDELVRLKQPPDLIVRNFNPNKQGLKFEIVGNRLHFTAVHNEKKYDLWQPIPDERLKRLREALDLQ